MIAFSNVMREYSDWRRTADVADSQVSNYKYVWEVPQEALDTWKDALDEYADRFTTEELNNYKSMFQIGRQMTGIYIGATSPDSYCRLYELTEYVWSFTIPDVLCSIDYNIISHSPYSSVATFPSGQTFELPLLIKPRSLRFTSIFDGNDAPSNALYGIISGYDFDILLRQHNRIHSESMYGFINYKTGDIHVVRSNTENEIKFEKYYDQLEKLLAAASSTSSGSGSSSGSGGAASTTPQFPPPPPYDYVDIPGELVIIAPPIKTILEIDTDGDPR